MRHAYSKVVFFKVVIHLINVQSGKKRNLVEFAPLRFNRFYKRVARLATDAFLILY